MSEVSEPREVTLTKSVRVSAFCDRCKADIPFVIPDLSDGNGPSNPRHAGLLVLQGWYGGFVDLEAPKSLLCESCCQLLCEFVGWHFNPHGEWIRP